MASDISTSEAPAGNTTPRLDLPELLGKLYAALREWELRRKKLIDIMAASILLHDFPKFQPKFCGGKTWPKWARFLKPIRRGRAGIGNLAMKRHGPPLGEVPSLRDALIRAAGRAESRIEESLDAFSGELQFPPLWEYVVERLKKKCGLLFDDPEFPDFADRLEVYIRDDDNRNQCCTLADQERLSNRIADLDRAGFDDDLLAEIWTRFPRQCERMKLMLAVGVFPAKPDGAPHLGSVDRKKMQVLTHKGWIGVQSGDLLDAIERLTNPKGQWLINWECFGRDPAVNTRLNKLLAKVAPAVREHVNSGILGYRWNDVPNGTRGKPRKSRKPT